MTSLKTSIKTITYLSDIGCLEIQGASLRVIRKFVNETYHIENEFICQLDPTRFDLIPEYVIVECDRLLLNIGASNDDAELETA